MLISDFFVKKGHRRAVTSEARGLERLQSFNVTSANCTFLTTADGVEVNEEIGKVEFFHSRGRLLVDDQSVYVSRPDGLKAEDRDRFLGRGETVRLWFLYQRIPRVLVVVVEQHAHLKSNDVPRLNPSSGVGFPLRPLSDVIKQDQRNSLRFSHRTPPGALPVYPQVLFDVFAMRTNLQPPSEGAIPPWIETSESIHTPPSIRLDPTTRSVPRTSSPGSRTRCA